MSLFGASFPLALQILESKTVDELTTAKSAFAELQAELQKRKPQGGVAQHVQLEFIFELTLCKFLTMLLAYQSQTLQAPYDQEEFNKTCKMFADAQKVGLSTNTMRMMRALMNITALVFKFNELDLNADGADDFMIRPKALEVMQALYGFIEIFSTHAEDNHHGLSAEELSDMKACVNHVVPGEANKDHAPQTQMQQYMSIIGNIYLAKLLKLREQYIEQDKSGHSRITAIDSLIWRMNLHKYPKIRTILHRYVSITQLQMRSYLPEKMYLDFRKKPVFSILVDNKGNQADLCGQFKSITDCLFGNLESEYKKLFLLECLRLDNRKRGEADDDMQSLDNSLLHGASCMLYEAQLLCSNINAIVSFVPELRAEAARVSVLMQLAACILLQVTTDANKQNSLFAVFKDVNVSQLPLDWLTQQHHADALGYLLCTRFTWLLYVNQKNVLEVNKLVVAYIYDLHVLLEKVSKTKSDKHLLKRLILDLYVHLKQQTRDLKQLPDMKDLSDKMAPLQDHADYPLQCALLDEMTGKLTNETRYKKFEKVMQLLNDNHLAANIKLLSLLFDKIECSARPGMTKAKSQREVNAGNLLDMYVQMYLGERCLEINQSVTQIEARNANYPSFDEDLNVEAACSYPDKENMIVALFDLVEQIDLADNNETLAKLKSKLDERENELKKFEMEFDDLFGVDVESSDHYQTMLYAQEKDLILLMKAMIFRKKKSLKFDVSDEEVSTYKSDLKSLSDYSDMLRQIDFDNTFEVINAYIGLMAAIFDYLDADLLLDNKKHLDDKIELVLNLVLVATMLSIGQDKISYLKNIPMEYLMNFRHGFKILKNSAGEPVTQIQQHLMRQITPVIDKLLQTRDMLERVLLGYAKEGEKKAIQALSVRYDIGFIDILLTNFNLVRHPTVRKLFGARSNGSLSFQADVSMQNLHPLSTRFLQGNNDKNTKAQLVEAMKIAVHNIYQCLFAYNAIGVVEPVDQSAYEGLKQSIILHTNFIVKDSVGLMTRCLEMCVKHPELRDDVDNLELAMSSAKSILDAIDKSSTFTTTKVMRAYSLSSVRDNISQEVVTTAYVNEMCCALNQRSNTEDRVDYIKNVIDKLLPVLEMLLSLIGKLEQYKILTHSQSITDIYLHLLSQCETKGEFDLVINSELHTKVMALKLTEYQAAARAILIDALKRIPHAKVLEEGRSASFDSTLLSESDTETCVSLISGYIKSFDKASKLFKKAHSDEEKDEHELIYMSSSQFILFRDIVKSIVNRAASFERAAKMASELNLRVLDDIERYYAAFLNKTSSTLQPDRLGFNVVSMKPTSVVKSSFIAAEKPVVKTQKKKFPAKAAAPKSAAVKQKSNHEPKQTDFNSLCRQYNNDLHAIAVHYVKILNHDSHVVRNNQQLQLDAVVGLAETITRITDPAYRSEFLSRLVTHTALLLKMGAPATPEQVFGDRYKQYRDWIEPHLPKAAEKVDIVRVILKRAPAASKPVIGTNTKARTVVVVKKPNRIENPAPAKRLFSQYSDDVFANCRKNIYLTKIILTENESRMVQFLHRNQLQPLLAGEVVRNAIRSMPYASIQIVCFREIAGLEVLLKDNLSELQIKSIEGEENRLVIVFNSGQSLTLVCIHCKSSEKSAALQQYASLVGVGIEIFYCPVTKNIIDPCRLYTRIKNYVLDTAKLFESKEKMRDVFALKPENMLLAIGEVSKCRHYRIALECSALKHLIIQLSYMLSPGFSNKRLSWAAFDDIFLKGFASFSLLHLEYDVMNTLFPVFSRNRHDSEIINKACIFANERYHKWAKKNPASPRIEADLTGKLLVEFRVAFIDDLLREKYLATRNLRIYQPEGRFFQHQTFGDDITLFLAQCNMPTDDEMLIALEHRWSQHVIELLNDRGLRQCKIPHNLL